MLSNIKGSGIAADRQWSSQGRRLCGQIAVALDPRMLFSFTLLRGKKADAAVGSDFGILVRTADDALASVRSGAGAHTRIDAKYRRTVRWGARPRRSPTGSEGNSCLIRRGAVRKATAAPTVFVSLTTISR